MFRVFAILRVEKRVRVDDVVYFYNRLPMAPAITLARNDVRENMVSALSDPMLQGLVDDGLVSPDTSRWTMYAKHGFLRKEVRITRNPNWKPQISDLIYALQSRS